MTRPENWIQPLLAAAVLRNTLAYEFTGIKMPHRPRHLARRRKRLTTERSEPESPAQLDSKRSTNRHGPNSGAGRTRVRLQQGRQSTRRKLPRHGKKTVIVRSEKTQRLLRKREAQRRYERSAKGRATKRRYAQSPKGRDGKWRYDGSLLGRERRYRYSDSPKGRDTRWRYEQTPARQAYRREWARRYRKTALYKERQLANLEARAEAMYRELCLPGAKSRLLREEYQRLSDYLIKRRAQIDGTWQPGPWTGSSHAARR